MSKFRIFCIILAAIGLYLVLMSPEMASSQASSFVRRMGGVADKEETLRRLEVYAASYRLLGGIFLGIGLFYTFSKDHK
ncbi:hypothetical protein [Paenibacillus tyrfis]|uniref:hypothetical protein n=1 Tax=Paenibacillus tyrfis TaxID=1501230 RepID=UPI000B5898A9|nr:hypothetical protein [Paenibacillus tyrfis]